VILQMPVKQYPPNTTQWRSGDVVLHFADAKQPKMFMRVEGYTRDGLCKTRYIDPQQPRKVYTNPVSSLLNIRDFDFKEDMKQADFEACRRWNHFHQVGTVVDVRLDSGEIKRTKTRSTAQLLVGFGAAIWLEDVSGCYKLSHVTALE
jgi:hypothetical protein